MSKLPILRQHFFANLPSRVVKLEVDIKRFFETADIDLLHPAYVNAHNLAGSGSMFGCPEISEAAHSLETILTSLQNTQPKIDEYIIASLTQALQTLQKSVTEALTHFSNFPDASASDEEIAEFHTRQLQHERLAYIVEDDLLLAKNLAIQLSYFGYQARIFDSPQSLIENTDGVIPAAIIMDIVFPAGGLSGLQLFANNIVPAFSQVPLIFISGKNDFQSRLEAARAGAAAYFPKPIDIGALINTLDSLTAGESPIPYRVLVIDDDEPTARYHANLLQLAGMQVAISSNPMTILESLAEFMPDLILCDMYMPVCNGIEMAEVIRQNDAFIGIPIVFLSIETSIDKQLLALRQGGDDFLTKPVKPARLISIISSRAQRSRILRAYMDTDGLTGLLNHSRLKERLEVEALSSKRHQRPLSLAMLDLDFFKTINDAYGHPAGDRVIRSLAKLLKQRLRRTDIASRYGGEEFAVILPDTDILQAQKVMEDIRLDFSSITQLAGDKPFTTTFSCGIGELKPQQSTRQLLDATDTALYLAKRKGKNRIAIAS